MQTFRVTDKALPAVAAQLNASFKEVIDAHSAGEHDIGSLMLLIQRGFLQLWLVVDEGKVRAWAITEIFTYPKVRRLRFVYLKGEVFEDWSDEIKVVEKWAQELGATEVEAWVRPGLTRKLKDFAKKYEVVVKKL